MSDQITRKKKNRFPGQWCQMVIGDPLKSRWLSLVQSAGESAATDTKSCKRSSLSGLHSDGQPLEMRLSGDLGFFLFWVRPEIPQAELTPRRTAPVLVMSRDQEGSKLDQRGRTWVNSFKVQIFNSVLILSEAKGSSHFLFYPNQPSSL